MRQFYFELTNLKNDNCLCFLPKVEQSDIELAIKLHKLDIEDIGIQIREVEPE